MDKTKLEWKNLRIMTCPKCSGKLYETGMGYKCANDSSFRPCDFRISYDRFNEVVKSLYQPTEFERRQAREVTEEENLRELNNL